MAGNEVYMNVTQVRQFSKQYDQISQLMDQAAKMIEMLSNMLKASAFLGMVGNAALAFVLDAAKPQVQNMSQQCEEMSQDLSKAADAYERGDAQGATRFY